MSILLKKTRSNIFSHVLCNILVFRRVFKWQILTLVFLTPNQKHPFVMPQLSSYCERSSHITDHTSLLSVVLQLGTLYQQLFENYLHHHPVSAAISKLNFFAGRMALIHYSSFVLSCKNGRTYYLSYFYLLTYSLNLPFLTASTEKNIVVQWFLQRVVKRSSAIMLWNLMESRPSVCLLPPLYHKAFFNTNVHILAGASKGTPGDAKCVTEILGGQK